MTNAYQKHLSELVATKERYLIQNYLINSRKEIESGKIKITKKVAKFLTIEFIITMASHYKTILKLIPDYGTNDVRALLIDWLLDMKLDREYKKPTSKELMTIFANCVHCDIAAYAILLFKELNITKQSFINMYKYDNYSWVNMLNMTNHTDFRPTENDIRTLFKKHRDIVLIQTVSHFTDEEARFVLNYPGNEDYYSKKRYITKHIKQFSDKILFLALLQPYTHDKDLLNKIIERLIKSEQPGLQTIVNHLFGYDIKVSVLTNPFLKFLKDEALDTTLTLLPQEKKREFILHYYNISEEDLKNWNTK